MIQEDITKLRMMRSGCGKKVPLYIFTIERSSILRSSWLLVSYNEVVKPRKRNFHETYERPAG